MKIALDVTMVGTISNDRAGLHHYIVNLILALQRIDSQHEYTLFFNFFRPEHLPAFQQASKLFSGIPNFKIKLSRFPRRLYRKLDLPVDFFIGPQDIFHGLYDFLPRSIKSKLVVTIHDLRYLQTEDDSEHWKKMLLKTPRGEQYLADWKIRQEVFHFLRHKIAQTVKRADAIITISHFSKKQLVDLLNVSEEKVKVVYQGMPNRFSNAQDEQNWPQVKKLYGLSENYLLYVSRFDPFKNQLQLLKAFQLLKRRFKPKEKLVLAGPVNWCFQIIQHEAKKMNLEEEVIFTGYVDDNDLPTLYRRASMLVFPSLFEGFGRPVLEAMACGTPVICSRVCSLPEIAGEAALLVDPCSVEEIAGAMERLLSDRDLADSLICKGFERVKLFTWENTARQTISVYNQIGGGNPS